MNRLEDRLRNYHGQVEADRDPVTAEEAQRRSPAIEPAPRWVAPLGIAAAFALVVAIGWLFAGQPVDVLQPQPQPLPTPTTVPSEPEANPVPEIDEWVSTTSIGAIRWHRTEGGPAPLWPFGDRWRAVAADEGLYLLELTEPDRRNTQTAVALWHTSDGSAWAQESFDAAGARANLATLDGEALLVSYEGGLRVRSLSTGELLLSEPATTYLPGGITADSDVWQYQWSTDLPADDHDFLLIGSRYELVLSDGFGIDFWELDATVEPVWSDEGRRMELVVLESDRYPHLEGRVVSSVDFTAPIPERDQLEWVERYSGTNTRTLMIEGYGDPFGWSTTSIWRRDGSSLVKLHEEMWLGGSATSPSVVAADSALIRIRDVHASVPVFERLEDGGWVEMETPPGPPGTEYLERRSSGWYAWDEEMSWTSADGETWIEGGHGQFVDGIGWWSLREHDVPPLREPDVPPEPQLLTSTSGLEWTDVPLPWQLESDGVRLVLVGRFAVGASDDGAIFVGRLEP